MTQDTRTIICNSTALGYSWTIWNADGTIDSTGDGCVSMKAADNAAHGVLEPAALSCYDDQDPISRPSYAALRRGSQARRVTGGYP